MRYAIVFVISTCVVLSMGVNLFAQPNGGVSFVSEAMVTGNYEDVKVVGDMLYCANRYGVVVYDLADWDPEDPPTETARFLTVGTAYGLFIQDSLCFVADGEKGLGIFDISDLHSVVRLGYFEDATSAVAVTVRDEIAYVLCSRTGVYSLDVSDPRRPRELGFIDARSEIRTLILREDVLWMGAWAQEFNTFLTSIDISNPSQMRLISQLEDYATADFAIEADVAFIGTGTLRSIDISNPQEMQLIDTLIFRNNQGSYIGMSGSLYSEGKLYGDRGIMSIADVRDPADLQMVGYLRNDHLSRKLVAIHQDHVFASAFERGLKVVDVSDPREPELIHINNNTGMPVDVAIDGDYLYVADALSGIYPTPREQQGRFRVFSIGDIQHPRQLAVLGSFDGRGAFNNGDQAVAFIGNIAYFGWGSMNIISVANPNNPRVINDDPDAGLSSKSVFYEDYVISVNPSAIIINSFADPRNPEHIAMHLTQDRESTMGCIVTDTLLYVPVSCNWEYWELRIYDWTDPRDLQQVGESYRLPQGQRWEWGIKHGDYLYWVAGDYDFAGLAVVSVANPLEPELVYFTEEVRHGRDIKVFNNLLFIADGSDGVRIFTLDDPEEPEQIISYDTPGSARKLDVDVDRGYMVVADYSDVTIYDVGQILGVWDLTLSAAEHDFGEIPQDSIANWQFMITNQSQRDIFVDSVTVSNVVFSTDIDTAFVLETEEESAVLVSFIPDTSEYYSGHLTVYSQERELEVMLSGTGLYVNSVTDNTDLPAEFALYPAYPNPFNGQFSFEIQLPQADNVHFYLYDVTGRQVWSMSDRFTVGIHRQSIDMDSRSAGVYFLRAESSFGTSTKRVVMLK